MASSVSRELAILIAGRDTSGSAALRNLRGELLGVDAAAKQAGGGMDTASSKTSALGVAARGVAMAGVAALGVAAVASAKNAIDAGISYETAFAGVRKTVDATEEEFAQFSAGIRKMATEIPASREEIARVAEAAGQLGIKKEALLGFTRTMIDLGVATNMSSEQAADSLARLANITRMPHENFDRLGSTVVALGNKMEATESEIVTMAMRLASAGDQVGMSEDQILSFAAALSSVGIEAEMGGTAFSRTIADMANAVGKGGEDLQKFAEIAGMSADDFAAKFKEDAAGALVLFLQGLSRVKAEGGNLFAVLEELGMSEMRQSDTVRRLAGAHGKVTDALAIGNKAWEDNTALTKEAEERYKTTASEIKIMENKFSDMGVELFQVTRPALHAVLDVLSGIPKALADVRDGFSEGQIAFDAAGPSIGNLVYAATKFSTEMREWQEAVPVSASRIQELSKEGYTFQEAYAIAKKEADGFAASVSKMGSNAENALPALRALSEEMLRQQGIELAPRPPSRYGPEAQGEVDAYTAAVRGGYALAQDAQEVYNDYNQRAYKNSQEAARKTAQEAESASKRAATAAANAAEKAAEKVKDTLWDIGQLGKKMVAEVDAALRNETDLWEEYGNKWIEKWSDVDAAIQKTYADRQTALDAISASENISKDIDARRKEVSERISGEKKAFDIQMDDTDYHHREELSKAKAMRDYQQALDKASNGEQRNAAWETYRERLAQIQQEHIEYDAEVQWRLSREKVRADREAEWAKQQAALEKTLHEEELTRQRDAIDAKQRAEEDRINAEWSAWQEAEKAKTVAAGEDAKARAQANLAAWRDQFIDKLEKESEPGVERFMGMVAGKWADALAGIAGATAASGGGEPGGGENWNATEEARHQPGGDIFEQWKANEPEQYEAWRQEHGMQRGGSFVVPGTGAPDSRIVAFAASPKERVTVTPAGMGASVTQVINLQGNYIGFDRNSLEELARQLKPYLDSLVRL